MSMQPPQMPDRVGKGPTFNQTVLKVLARMTQSSGQIDQNQLRNLISLAPSYLLVDSTIQATTVDGVNQWALGFNRICEVIIALHRKSELELETLNEASRACAEAWSICGSWRGLDTGRTVIGNISTRLRENVLDPDGVSYKEQAVYIP